MSIEKSKKGKEKADPHPLFVRLKDALNAKTDKQISQMLKVTKQSVFDWKQSGKIKRERLESVAALTGVSLGWLLTGEGEKFPAKKTELSVKSERVSKTAPKDSKPPQVAELLSVAVLKNNRLFIKSGDKTMSVPQRFMSVASQLIEIESNDWEAEGFQKGDVLIVEPINGEVPNNRLVVAEVNSQATIRKIELREGMAYFPALKHGPAFSVLQEQVKLHYVVTATIHPE